MKFDNLTSGNPFVLNFDSNRTPVGGDFYTKGGNGGSNGFAIFNDGADEHDTADSVTKFIARPDTVAVKPVPEPWSFSMLGAGLLGLALVMSRGRKSV